jgi:hypothetical protein
LGIHPGQHHHSTDPSTFCSPQIAFKTHNRALPNSDRVRRKRERLPSNGSILSDRRCGSPHPSALPRRITPDRVLAFGTTISPEAAREVTKVHNDYDDKIRGLSGQVEKVYTTGDLTFEFANLRQKASGVRAFDTSNISKSTGLEVSGFIGISTLRQLTLTIDYRDGLVQFVYDPNRGYRDSSF